MSEKHSESSQNADLLALEYLSKLLRQTLAGIDDYRKANGEGAELIRLHVITPSLGRLKEEIERYMQPSISTVDIGLSGSNMPIRFPGEKK